MCDPILVNLLKMQRHYSQSSRENATPSSGTSLLASCKGVPPPLVSLHNSNQPSNNFLQAFIKQAYKFGVIHMKENQQTEEELFGNENHSRTFDDFLDLLGQRVRLRGFDKYRAGLDSNNDLTGTHSVYTKFANNEIMFHVSTLLPFEECDSQKVSIVTLNSRGGSRNFFRRGCTCLLLYFNTNKPHSFFFLQNTSCIRKPQVISGGGAHPLHPPPRSAPEFSTLIIERKAHIYWKMFYASHVF